MLFVVANSISSKTGIPGSVADHKVSLSQKKDGQWGVLCLLVLFFLRIVDNDYNAGFFPELSLN